MSYIKMSPKEAIELLNETNNKSTSIKTGNHLFTAHLYLNQNNIDDG